MNETVAYKSIQFLVVYLKETIRPLAPFFGDVPKKEWIT